MFTCADSTKAQRRGNTVHAVQLSDNAHLILGTDAVAANLAPLNVLQLQLGNELLHVRSAFDVVLVAEYLRKSNVSYKKAVFLLGAGVVRAGECRRARAFE